MIYDELLEAPTNVSLPAHQQEAKITKYCLGIEQDIERSTTMEEALTIATVYCKQFDAHCTNSVLRAATKNYVHRVISRRWIKNGQ